MVDSPTPQPAGLMFLQPDVIALPVFAVVMAFAAFEDFRRLVIPNLLPVILCVAWPLHFAAAPSLVGAFSAIGCALAVFIVGAALFARGFLGGGDVKLLTAATLWAGAAGTRADPVSADAVWRSARRGGPGLYGSIGHFRRP
jgi:hypothetical protein